MEKHYIKEQFVTYEIALAMNELGFKEECLAHFNNPPYPDLMLNCENVLEGDFVLWDSGDSLKAPLWQQCIDWFIEKYRIHINIVHNLSELYLGECYVGIYNNPKECITGLRTKEYPTYQQAREQAILKCIELLKKV